MGIFVQGTVGFDPAYKFLVISYLEGGIRQQSQLTHFDNIFSQAPIGTALLSATLDIVQVNSAWCRLLGFEEHELSGNSFVSLLHSEDHHKIQSICAGVSGGGELPAPLVVQCRTKSGAFINLECALWRLANSEDSFVCQLRANQQISKRLHHEAELREKMSILNAITARMPVVIYRYSREDGMTIQFGNPDLTRAFERSKMVRLTVEQTLSQIIDKVSSFKDHQGYLNFSSSNQDGNEEVYFDNFVFESDRGETESGFIGLALDVTERRIAEHNLKRNSKNLEKINKELNQFAYIVSHDLKTPLRGIITLSEWIEEDLKGAVPDDVKHNLAMLRGRVHRLESLINGILQYSRVSRGAQIYEQVDTASVIRESVEVLVLPEEFTLEIANDLPVIMYSKIDLERIILNLVTNAVKHHDKSVGIIQIGCREEDEFFVFFVKDDGPGIEPAYHEKIFQIFQTLQNRDVVESTGIGLSIVRKIVEDRGGTITVDSQPGSGSTFIFTVPKNQEPEKIISSASTRS